jgi:chorismate mutase-like protein
MESLKAKKSDSAAQLAPYRARIDAIDRQIVALLRARYDVIEEVGHLKAREGIPAIIPERVEEVRQNAMQQAAACGLDAAFIGEMYAQLINHSCALEEVIIEQQITLGKKAAGS